MLHSLPDSTAESLPPAPPSPAAPTLPPCELLLRELLDSSILLGEDWDKLNSDTQKKISQCDQIATLLSVLEQHRLLTDFQVRRIAQGKIFGLVLGNYRVLAHLGSGAMGQVFKAEHMELRKHVALKIVEISDLHDPVYLRRFRAEMRMVAQLQHPNIVAANDSGKCQEPGPAGRTLWYFVMDYVPGENLEYLVLHGERFESHKTCDIAHQIASALAEANRQNLVHRDIKPSNILLTRDGQAKLLDFGLARNLCSRDTRRGALIGTIEFMALEQADDSSTVDIRADIFGLGATMFWCLTGRRPFAPRRGLAQAIAARRTEPTPRLRQIRPDLSPELDEVVAQMMAAKVEDRLENPELVMAALEPLLEERTREQLAVSPRPHSVADLILDVPGAPTVADHRILIISDGEITIGACRRVLAKIAIPYDVAADSTEALQAMKTSAYDLVLVDLELEGMGGTELCRRLRGNASVPHQKTIAMSARSKADDAARLMLKYVNDFLSKPLSAIQLQARILAALCTKDQQDNADRLNQHLIESSRNATGKALPITPSNDSSVWNV